MIIKRRIAIVGSRQGVWSGGVETFVDKLDPVTTIVVSGGAKGVDSVAANRARERRIEVEEILPLWEKYGKSAGFRRNKEIVARANEVVAFWNGDSKGTEHTINIALKAGKPVAIFGVGGDLLRYYPGDGTCVVAQEKEASGEAKEA